ncbi:rpl31 (nucleomorph) [Hemiselmis andersenii]|uniref:Rpl31 n=1 Tax=Hemiselmis andersenii TaxID=464988 RepID=A9BKC2_HEMAN|nr:rpl31 [Hemiselmis andersenii]ABW97955.1 rpl31 [Hemiselmis andersenii]|mmetsp:Transcript_6095/g.14052  ORF Transcript_6095/g.14052 Transcript_6095/m.14052 type:complete len:109 (-) Transcript_6095:751-1077(-)
MGQEFDYSIECNLNLHKRMHGIKFKRRVPQAILEIKKFAQKVMNSKNIRIDTQLNKFLWLKGTKHTPIRVRILLVKKRFVSDNFDGWVIFVFLSKNENFKNQLTKIKK